MAGVWKKTLVYLGLAEDEEYEEFAVNEYEEENGSKGSAVRRLPDQASDRAASVARKERVEVGRRERSEIGRREMERRYRGERDAVVRAMPTTSDGAPRVHLVTPNAFNDAQEIGDEFRQGHSVLMNLQSAGPDLSRRIVDFASGLAYGLSGAMQPVAEKVFLITPAGVQVSAEERRRLAQERGFFNQL
jgi:cell division inhibitor SepF